MPLSEREQKILEEIERNLYEEDPKFARDVRRRAPRMDEVRRIKLGAVLFASGLAVLVGFFVSQSLLVGVVAFGAMVAGIVLVAGSIRGVGSARAEGGAGRRDRLARRFEEWESRMRQRYKRS
ncbi:MAG TPA: DUF3040 domain-containing protein [Actinomycetota bacterium]|nr:DUF3040 domain-containing protein [Actinomycetota bacterium]